MGCLNGMSSGARVDLLRPLATLIILFQLGFMFYLAPLQGLEPRLKV